MEDQDRTARRQLQGGVLMGDGSTIVTGGGYRAALRGCTVRIGNEHRVCVATNPEACGWQGLRPWDPGRRGGRHA